MSTIMSQLNGDVQVVYLNESRILDEQVIQQMAEEISKVCDRAEAGKLLLNFEKVRFMSSAMLGKLMQLNKKCKQEEVSLKLSNICPEIMEVFTMMRLNKVLDLYDEEEQALNAFAKKGWFS